VQPAKPPVPVSATLTYALGEVVVKFDQATDQGGQLGVFNCALLLDAATVAKVGAKGTCRWATVGADTFESLVIEMGFGASLVPKTARSAADTITLKTDIIRSSAQNSWYSSGGVFLDRPATSIPVSAKIAAPAEIGVCDGFTLSSADSVGSGGRPFAISYSVTSTADVRSASLAIANANNMDTISVASGALVASQTYTFSVRMENFVGKFATASVEVTKAEVPLPQISVVNAGTDNVFSVDRITLNTVVEQPDTTCAAALTAARLLDVGYAWSPTVGEVLMKTVLPIK
jgi:hypothetical protein